MSINQDLWSASLPNGEVRSGTLEQLRDACRSGHLSEATLVRASSSDHWIKLADVLGGAGGQAVRPPASVVPPPRASVPSPPAATPSVSPPVNGDADLWQVRLANGEVRSGTRQQLAEAFRTGHLDAEMPVLAAGAREWERLGTVIERSETPRARVAPSASPPPSASLPLSASPTPPVDPPRAPSAPPATSPLPGLQGGDDIWLLRLPDGQVRSGTRQQLEEAFRAGGIDEGALVLPDGATEWTKLGSVVVGRPSAPAEAPVAAMEPAPARAQPAMPDAAPQQTPASASEQVPAPPGLETSSPVQAEVGTPAAVQTGGGSDSLWQVKLTREQLAKAFHAGLLGDDTLVLAPRSDQWVKFSDAQQPPSAPSGTSLGVPSSPSAPATNGAGAPALDAAPGANSAAEGE